MKTSLTLLGLVAVSMTSSTSGYTIRTPSNNLNTYRTAASASTSMQMSTEQFPDPTTFREAEILGLRLMQEGNFEEALVGRFCSAYAIRSCIAEVVNEFQFAHFARFYFHFC